MTKTWCAGLAVLVCSAAFAQYSSTDPRNINPEYERRQKELQQQEKDKVDKQRLEEDSARDAVNYQAFMENQRKLQEKLSGDVERDRALFMKTPPIPPQKNTLLGQWRLDRTKKKPANAIAEINAAISQPASARWCSATAFGTSGRKRCTVSMPASARRS